MPDISDIMMMGAEKIQISDTTMLMLRNQGLSAGQRCIKRIFDIVVGILAVIIASPVMLIIAIAIKAYDGGPVFFTQSRLTRDGQVFKIYKFRSMRVQKENEKNCITRKNDDRITPVGHIIRKLHLDELPQIINIIKGDMSWVGPRPEWTATTEQYAQNLPEFLLRLKVKAGLTGYAQIYGKYNTTPYDKLMLDLTYIEKYSFLLDLKLMILTLKVLFEKENTEGIEDWQTSAEVEENAGDLG
jgi:lipopolysaccharide/colanic/teichoic acid biosynthesis glycosyltransferase